MSTTDQTGDYEVGYGKPPKQHQFKPKHTLSKGKRKKGKKAQSLAAMLTQELLEPTSFAIAGKPLKLPAIQVVVKQVKNKALAGDPKAIFTIMKLAQDYLPQDAPEEGIEDELSPAEQAVMDDFLAAKALFEGPDNE